VVKLVSRLRLLRAFPSICKGKHVTEPFVECYRAKCVSLSSIEPLEVFADGEHLQETPVTIQVVPGAFNVVVPNKRSVEAAIALCW
jgi:diacylglycerol kinase (ATP)